MSLITPDALWGLLLRCIPIVNGQPMVAPENMAQIIQIGEWHGQPMHSETVSLPNAKDGSRDYGLAQINSGNFFWLGLTEQTALDPCQSITAGARVFASTASYNAGNSRTPAGINYALRTFITALTPASPPVTPRPCPIADADDDGWHTLAQRPDCLNPSTKDTPDDAP